jgi:uncharacterized protein YecT (DUF1311 family)
MSRGWWIPILAAGVVAHAASFDCAKVKTPQEKAICASPELSAADDQMAEAYRAVLAAAAPEMTAMVRNGQRAWIREMAVKCPSGASASLMESATSLDGCLRDFEDSRTKALQHMVTKEGGVTFIWQSITLTAPDSKDNIPSAGEAKPGFGTMSASWPQSSAATPEWKAWNLAIRTAAQEMAARAHVGQGARWDPGWAQDMDEQVSVSIGIVTNTLVTATVSSTWYGHGAAHENEDFMELNWLLNESHELRSSDVFRTGSGWDRVMADRCLEALNKQAGEDLRNQWLPSYFEKMLHDIVNTPSRWQLNASGLTITFEQGTVTCRACEADPVTIPWAELKPLLNPGFAIPTGRAASEAATAMNR